MIGSSDGESMRCSVSVLFGNTSSDWNPKRDSLQNLQPDRWTKSPTPPTEATAIIAR